MADIKELINDNERMRAEVTELKRTRSRCIERIKYTRGILDNMNGSIFGSCPEYERDAIKHDERLRVAIEQFETTNSKIMELELRLHESNRDLEKMGMYHSSVNGWIDYVKHTLTIAETNKKPWWRLW